MSFRQDNNLHFRTPYLLLKIPEYMRWFDSATIGSLYRLLSSKIYRRGVNQLRFYKEGTYLTELAKRYDAGKLCCYMTDEEIQDAMLMQGRRIIDLKKELQELKLIKVEKFKDGYIYELGIIYQHQDTDGYKTGQESEGHYIDQWYTWANCEEDSEQMLAFRYYLAEKLGSDKKKQEVQSEICKILHGIEKNFAQILSLKTSVKPPVARAKTPAAPAPIEVNTNEDMNYVPPTGEGEELFDLLPDRLTEFKGKLKFKGYSISHLSKDFRRMLTLGATKEVLSDIVLSTVHETNRFPELPLFSKHLDVKYKNATEGFVWLWFALREDVTRAAPPADKKGGMYKETRIAFANLEGKYEVEQVRWTLKEIAKNSKARLALVTNHFAIAKMLGDYSAQYTQFVANNRLAEAKTKAQAASEAVSEETKREFLKEVSRQAVVVSAPVVVEDQSSIEYWQAKKDSATNPTVLAFYQGKIDDILRSKL